MKLQNHNVGLDPAPVAIRAFAGLYVAFALAAFANNMSMLDRFQEELGAAIGSPAPTWLGTFGFGIRLAIRLVLTWFVVCRRSSVARWLVLLISLPWLWNAFSGVPALFHGEPGWFPWAAAAVLQLAALCFLFAPSAIHWLSHEGQALEADVEDFS